MNEIARKTYEHNIADMRSQLNELRRSDSGFANGDISTTTSDEISPISFGSRDLPTIESPLFRTNIKTQPSIFSVEFRAFQLSMSQKKSVKLQLQGIQSLYDLAARLEDEKDRVIERLTNLGLREDSFKILSITATTFR